VFYMTHCLQGEQRGFWKWCKNLSTKMVFRHLVTGRMLE
jgi:hypothetical protein